METHNLQKPIILFEEALQKKKQSAKIALIEKKPDRKRKACERNIQHEKNLEETSKSQR